MEDTCCPSLNCDFMGKDMEETFVHMLEVHKWHWKFGKNYPYSSEMMPIDVLRSAPQSKKPTFKVLASGTPAHIFLSLLKITN